MVDLAEECLVFGMIILCMVCSMLHYCETNLYCSFFFSKTTKNKEKTLKRERKKMGEEKIRNQK